MEPTLSQIDDFNGQESKEKKRVVSMVVFVLLLAGAIFSVSKATLDKNTPYITIEVNKLKLTTI
jgi:uncharacterized protein YxeA